MWTRSTICGRSSTDRRRRTTPPRTVATRLLDAGFVELELGDAWSDLPDAGFVLDGAAASSRGARRPSAAAVTPFRLAGAHTDSPCLRVKPRPDDGFVGWKQLNVEVYGGILNNSWLDRDLGVAGCVDDARTAARSWSTSTAASPACRSWPCISTAA